MTGSKPGYLKPYPYIRVEGIIMGSLPYYINQQIERAKETNAPENAVYEQHAKDGSGRTGEWVTLREYSNDQQLQYIKIARKNGWIL